MRIAIIGGTGLLGSELCRQCPDAVSLSRPTIDLANPATIRPALESVSPEAVINAAAYTQVDQAEADAKLCYAINADGVEELAKCCGQLDCRLLHVSTDYVFGGDETRRTPYRETDPPAPLGVYAKSKLAGEAAVRQFSKNLIVRVCGLYGKAGPGTPRPNFVDTMLRFGKERDELRVINDQTSTPSYVPHVARAMLFLLNSASEGTFHVVNSGEFTWYDMAQEIFRIARIDVRLTAITTSQWGAAAPRPAYSALDTTKYQQLGGPPLPDWRQALSEYIKSL